jgi:putative N6-adenine-specific DNA methylase
MTFRSWYATAPRGAEGPLEAELAALGAKGLRSSPGLVRFTGPRPLALRACLSLRTSLRVLEPVGDYPCASAEELYAGALTLPWAELVQPGQTIAVSASGKAPGLDHTHFVALKVKDAICDAIRAVRGDRPDVDADHPSVAVVVHLGRGRCSVSLDLAGALLSDRGYRVRSVEAPVREALGAVVVSLSGWRGQTPLHDPVCGSGTLPIEAALFALGRAPGLGRTLACEAWPRTQAEDAVTLRALREELTSVTREREADGIPEIFASDRDAEAVQAAHANVAAAGLSKFIQVEQADARQIRPLGPGGQLLLNVPYGERLDLGGKKQLKSFYHSLGAAFRALSGHQITVLTAADEFESAFGMRPAGQPVELWNGPLRCKLLRYQVR